MTITTRHAPLFRSFELWSRFALDNTAMLFAAGEVIGKRTAQMATHGIAPDAQQRREMHRMVEEKRAAVLEGSLAAWTEWMRLGQASWLETARVAMRNGAAFAPLMVGMHPGNSVARGSLYARRATTRSMASASRQWTAPLDTQLKIAEAAFKPVRARVAANRERLSA